MKAFFCLACLLPLLAACSGASPRPEQTQVQRIEKTEKPATASTKFGGGYYLDDGPGDNPPPNLDEIPDAEPKSEPLHKFANNPYTVLGQSYTPATSVKPYRERGIASWYGRKFHGQKTSSGEKYDMYAMTAAHCTLPIPSYARVTNLKNNKSVIVRINDRGPFHSDRLIDLSYTAAYKLGVLQNGSAQVEVAAIDPMSPPAPAIAAASAPPAPADKVATVPVETDGGGKIFLQMGAFSVQENAEQLLGRLKAQLGQLASSMQILAQNGLFRVRAGPYRSQAEASQAAARISQMLAITPVLVR